MGGSPEVLVCGCPLYDQLRQIGPIGCVLGDSKIGPKYPLVTAGCGKIEIGVILAAKLAD